MKSVISIMPNIGGSLARVMSLAAIVVLGTATSGVAQQNANPKITPPNARPYGRTLGEWNTAWWQWILSIPEDRNPNLDETGEFAGEGQRGKVWFLAGSFSSGQGYERTIRIPAGTAIFCGLFTTIWGAGVFDCDPSVPGVECDLEALRGVAADIMDNAPDELLAISIDGVPVQNPRAYRAVSPEPFPVYLPDGNFLGLPEGIYEPNVSDSYSLMLAPLSVGEHIIVDGTPGEGPLGITHIIVE